MSEENTTLKPALELPLTVALRDWMPDIESHGNDPSPEQLVFLSHLISQAHAGLPIKAALESVAGSGKTTVIDMSFYILAHAHRAGRRYSITATAFNGTIAAVVVNAMKKWKPDGADWTSGGGTGTLNSHGKKSLLKFFEHPMVLQNNRYTSLARIVSCDLLADPVLRADYENNMPLTKAGNKRESWSWFALARFIKAATEKAMMQGFFTPVGTKPSEEDWTTYMDRNRDSLRISDHPVGPQILAQLPSIIERVIDLGMFHLENEGEIAQCSPNAMVFQRRDQYSGFLQAASNYTDAELLEKGLRVMPPTTKQNGGSSVVAVPFTSRNYRTGKFTDRRIEIRFPNEHFDIAKAIKASCKKASMDKTGRFTMFGTSNDGPFSQEKWDKRSQATFQSDEWVFSVKDNQQDIDGFIATAFEHGIDVAPAFATGNQSDATDGEYAATFSHLDCIYAPAYFNIPAWRQFDMMFCDEVQDMSPLQHDLLAGLLVDGGNVVLVGDRRQSLYLFAGSDSRSFDYGVETYGCESFPMTICWRQTVTLADEVSLLIGSRDGQRTMYADHRSPVELIPTWKQGSSSTVHHVNALTQSVEVGDMVLCRITAPLVSYAVATLKQGIPARLAGGGDLESQVRNMWSGKVGMSMVGVVDKKLSELQSFTSRHGQGADYLSALLLKLTQQCKGDSVQASNHDDYRTATDMIEATLALADRYTTEESNPTSIGFCGDNKSDWLSQMFVDPNETGEAFVLFSSVHRAKGLERKTVHIITDRMVIDAQGEERLSPCFMLPWSMNTSAEIDQELNAVYVCITRSMDTQRYYTNNKIVSTGDTPNDLEHAMWMLNGDDIEMGSWPVSNDEDEDEDTTTPSHMSVPDPSFEDTFMVPTMPQFACVADSKVLHLTNDAEFAMDFIQQVMGEDYDVETYHAGTEVGGHSVWMTSEVMDDDITQAVASHWQAAQEWI